MLHPSYTDLMKVVNAEVEPARNRSKQQVLHCYGDFKRARQIIAGDEPLVDGTGKKPLSVAVEELNEGKIKIISDEEEQQEEA